MQLFRYLIIPTKRITFASRSRFSTIKQKSRRSEHNLSVSSMTLLSQHIWLISPCSQSFCYNTSAVKKMETTKLNEIASKVIQINSKFDVMAACIPIGTISDLLKSLFELGFSENGAVNLLTRSTWTTKKPELLVSILDIFKSYNLAVGTKIQILENLPLEFKEERRPMEDLPTIFKSNLDGLIKLGFSEDHLDAILLSSPQTLFLGFEHILSIMGKLNGLVDTKVDVLDLVTRCPHVLVEDWEETVRKFEYVYYEMVYEIEEIARSSVFNRTFDYIKDRHIYLTHTGYFIKIKRKDDERIVNPNPPLKTILDWHDHQLAKMFGNLSKEEYSVYLEMRKFEREEENSESESDDETR
ncbi:transcription termination factor 4, mitochondrial-like [Biomphalaria glabrata]|uniref:Transcription termination factor 4, mitochondrial-like n=1 Tax=Biomphalaria glabrata TaxID=6526 RepID=A0A9U8DVL7_BIOGL|nr:transcription termination factor 4, mitochondrial-like [Biomphalaria glabrata]